MQPTILGNVTPTMRIACEEVFGPVVAVMPVENFDEALKVANGVDVGLSASVVTRDIKKAMTYAERVAQPCIGQERADLVLAGCAILEALLRIWPCQRLRVADRGLREGILATLMAEDGHDRRAHRQAGRPRKAAPRRP